MPRSNHASSHKQANNPTRTKTKKVCRSFLTSTLPICRFLEFLLLEEILYSLIGNHTLVKHVSAGLRAFYHLDNLCICATVR